MTTLGQRDCFKMPLPVGVIMMKLRGGGCNGGEGCME
jgi:hypothetical protein